MMWKVLAQSHQILALCAGLTNGYIRWVWILEDSVAESGGTISCTYGTINIHYSGERRNYYSNFKLPKFNPTV